MSRTHGFNLNRDNELEISKRWGIRPEEIGRFAKKLLTNPSVFEQAKPVDVVRSLEMTPIGDLEKEVAEMSTEELKRLLDRSQKKKVDPSVIDTKGLYMQKNVEDYLQKFTNNWNRDMSKIPEMIYRVGMMYKEELVTQELMRRFTI